MIHIDDNFEKIAQVQAPASGFLKGLWASARQHPVRAGVIGLIGGPAVLGVAKRLLLGSQKPSLDPKTILIGSLLGLGGGGLYHMITADEEKDEERLLEKALIAGALLGAGAGALISWFY